MVAATVAGATRGRAGGDDPAAVWPAHRLGGSLVDLGAWLVAGRAAADRFAAAWLAGLAEFDTAGGWAADGALSCADWLVGHAGLGRATAFEKLRIAHALDARPVVAEALASGAISYSAARAILRIDDAKEELDRALVRAAVAGTVSDVEDLVRHHQACADQDRRPAFRKPSRGLRVRRLEDGLTRVEAILTDQEAAELERALRIVMAETDGDDTDGRAADHDDGNDDAESAPGQSAAADCGAAASGEGPEGRPGAAFADEPSRWHGEDQDRLRSWVQRRADALVTLAGRAHAPDAGAADRYLIHLVVTHDRTCTLTGGAVRPAEADRLACDCSTVVHHVDPDGAPLALGRRRRRWSRAQRRAIGVRDGGRCRWPGCERSTTDVHHLVPWGHGGRTDTANGLLLCPRHHTNLHAGWTATGDADHTITFHRPGTFPRGGTEAGGPPQWARC